MCTGQLVLVGGAEDMSRRGAYHLGRVHRVHHQWHKRKELVRRELLLYWIAGMVQIKLNTSFVVYLKSLLYNI